MDSTTNKRMPNIELVNSFPIRARAVGSGGALPVCRARPTPTADLVIRGRARLAPQKGRRPGLDPMAPWSAWRCTSDALMFLGLLFRVTRAPSNRTSPAGSAFQAFCAPEIGEVPSSRRWRLPWRGRSARSRHLEFGRRTRVFAPPRDGRAHSSSTSWSASASTHVYPRPPLVNPRAGRRLAISVDDVAAASNRARDEFPDLRRLDLVDCFRARRPQDSPATVFSQASASIHPAAQTSPASSTQPVISSSLPGLLSVIAALDHARRAASPKVADLKFGFTRSRCVGAEQGRTSYKPGR